MGRDCTAGSRTAVGGPRSLPAPRITSRVADRISARFEATAEEGHGVAVAVRTSRARAKSSAATRAKATGARTKWVYLCANGKAEGNAKMRALRGGKGAGLAEMTNAGLRVPPGFTITTGACNAYFAAGRKLPPGLLEQVENALAAVERATGKKLGDTKNPLLVSVRSGAAMSMPGMMDTVLNLGLNDESRAALAKLTKNERFAHDAYRRFISMFGRIVLGIDAEKFEHALEAAKRAAGVKTDPELGPKHLEQLVRAYKETVRRETGKPFPADPKQQLLRPIEADVGWRIEPPRQSA